MDISGKTAIVTGAASGIGLGIATALAEAGANVVMADIQKAAVEQAAHGLSGTNKRVMPVRIDVTQEQSVLDALAKAERNFGKLHIACNNAGVPMHGTPMTDVPQGDWEIELEGTNVGVSVLCPGPIATNIARGARNRPDHMGGPQIRANDEATLAERLATTGLDPKRVGERVVDAIRTKTFYAFVSAVPAAVIRARHRRIEDALNSPWVTHY